MEVASTVKRLIEDWTIYLQSTYTVKIKENKINDLYDVHYWVGVIFFLQVIDLIILVTFIVVSHSQISH